MHSFSEVDPEKIKKKPMKFHIEKLALLSAPRYQQYSCKKNNCSCSLHIKNESKSSMKIKNKKKLVPIKLY